MDITAGAAQLQSNPFLMLTFIVAPAILTNASALMVLSTTNRFARAIDRGRELSRQIEDVDKGDPVLDRLAGELKFTEVRAVYLLKATRGFYGSLGGFAFAAFISLLGASLVSIDIHIFDRVLAFVAVASVLVAVGGLVLGSILLFYETRMVVKILQDRIEGIEG